MSFLAKNMPEKILNRFRELVPKMEAGVAQPTNRSQQIPPENLLLKTPRICETEPNFSDQT